MTDILVPDGSQYQGVIDHAALVAYLRRTYGGAAGIFRLDYGDLAVDARADANIDAARAAAYDVLGWYCYLVAGRPAEPQADTFCRLLQAHGGLRPGEFIVVDDEESTGGDESGRVNAFLARCDANLKTPDPAGEDWWYSGLNFAIAHNLPAARGHRWIAAYGAGEPTAVGHDLWQETDAASLPGINGPVDASIFHGSIDDLRRLIGAPGGPSMGIATAASDGDLVAFHKFCQFYCFGPIDTSSSSQQSFVDALKAGVPMNSIIDGWLTLPQSKAWLAAVANLVADDEKLAHLETAGAPGVDPAKLQAALAKLAADQQAVLVTLQQEQADTATAAADPAL